MATEQNERMVEFARNAFYVNFEMIRFLLIENLALKTILHDKGLLEPEEFKKYADKASEILDHKFESQLQTQMGQLSQISKDV